MIVVSDNSPLQYLVLIGCIEALPALYGRLLTTPQIIAELKHSKAPQPVRAWAEALPRWLVVETPLKIDLLDRLDAGEASAIALAQEHGADLVLIDERAGVEVAQAAGFACVGTLGVLIEAGIEGVIDFDAAISRLTSETSFYASAKLIASAGLLFQQRKRNK